MNQETTGSDSGDDRLNQILAAYLEAELSGQSPDREQWLRRHPDIADELQAFFYDHDKMQALAEPVQPRVASDDESVTIAPTVIGSFDADSVAEAPSMPPGFQDQFANRSANSPPDSDVASDQTGGKSSPRLGTIIRYFGGYELLEEIARGGMGVVYRARQTNLNRIVALKMILAGQLASAADIKRFYNEAEAAANLDHPGIVPVFEVGEHEGQHYFSMGFIDGDSLAFHLDDRPFVPKQAAELICTVADAVQYAHDKRVIHRDLKPANILIDRDGQPKVTDFGLAKRTEEDSNLTGTGDILGTPSYMPPEQAGGRLSDVRETADVYALGAVLYATLTGRPPFQTDNRFDTLMQVLEREPVPPRQLNPKVPLDLETICLRCLEKDRRRRYASAAELSAELRRFLNGEPIKVRPISKVERMWRWCKRNPAVAGFSMLALTLLLVLGIGGPLVALKQIENAHKQAELRAQAEFERRMAEKAKHEAERQKGIAETNEHEARRNLEVAERHAYGSDMLLAQREWKDNQIGYLQERLNRYADRDDLKGFEWGYWNRLINSDGPHTHGTLEFRYLREFQPGREADRHRQLGQNGQGVGCGNRPGSPHPHRTLRTCQQREF